MDFSIIIPAKNEEINIALCLASLRELDYPQTEYEVLLIDNGSSDKTIEVASSYEVAVFVQPEKNIAGLRNFGANLARGNILVFLDADCTVAPNWLKSASVWIEQRDVCCFGGPPEVPEDGTWVQKAWYIVRQKKHLIEDIEWLESMNMFVRKEVFNAADGFDETLETCEDYDLSIRLKRYGRIVADSRIKAIHHGEAATLIQFYRKESWRGLSNLSGAIRHGFRFRELPSVLFPVVFVLCLFMSISYVLLLPYNFPFVSFPLFILLLALWQIPLLLIALLKGQAQTSLKLRLGLYVLLNIYFLARGRAILIGN